MKIEKFDIVAMQAIISVVVGLTLVLLGNYAGSIISLCLAYTSMKYANELIGKD